MLELYAHDESLEPLGAVSYIGVPLFDTDGRILGHLAVLHDAADAGGRAFTAVFNIFAGRAAAELRRLRRDRDLYEREQKLSRLIDSAMDAIVELDGELRIVEHEQRGGADLRLRRRRGAADRRSPDFLTPSDRRGKLTYLTAS